MLHSLLKRQLKKSGVADNAVPTIKQWQDFLEHINRAYNEVDQERYLIERSLTMSSREMQQLYDRLQKSETRYALASKGANDGLWDWDFSNEEIFFSKRCLEILDVEETAGYQSMRNCWLNKMHADEVESVVEQFKSHLKGKTNHFQNEHRVKLESGEYRWVLARGLAFRDEDGRAVRIAGSLTDITERKKAEIKLEYDSIHDSLTNLPNRKFLMERLKRSLERTQKDKKYSFALLFIDLDRFKVINDTMGHQTGDEILLKIADKLNYLIRPKDMVARLGGDEFVILVENIKDQEQVIRIADRIISTLKTPLVHRKKKFYLSASIGIAFSSPDYDIPDNLVRDADIAMYSAKIKGKGRYEVFEKQMLSGAVSYLQIQNDLHRAVENNEFALFYQPIVSLTSQELVGFESLIRWIHPVHGLIPPMEFIPIAEENGLILPIGKWVLRESCRQLSEWQETYKMPRNLFISVNISAKQIDRGTVINDVTEILAETNLSPAFLKLEITESTLMKNQDRAIQTVSVLREMGVKISIDDFGTGYSSLSYLHNFAIDTLKVDRSFVQRIGMPDEKTEIIQTIIALAANLGVDVIAEGVETEEQLQFLRENNCEFGQGYYYSRPVNSTLATELIGKLSEDHYEFFANDPEKSPAFC
jgi:diguanylate cyclase (GGDEF)-like protein/PAS domain S-box-containing protein